MARQIWTFCTLEFQVVRVRSAVGSDYMSRYIVKMPSSNKHVTRASSDEIIKDLERSIKVLMDHKRLCDGDLLRSHKSHELFMISFDLTWLTHHCRQHRWCTECQTPLKVNANRTIWGKKARTPSFAMPPALRTNDLFGKTRDANIDRNYGFLEILPAGSSPR